MSYLRENILNGEWLICAGIRAGKTMAQTAIASIGTSTLMSGVDWRVVVSTAVLSGVLSILTSIAGLPEVKSSDQKTEGIE